MSEKPRVDQAQVFPCPMYVRCQVFCCNNMGQHYIGRKDGPLNMCLVVCDDCLETIKKSLTPEKQKDSGEGYICDYCGKLFKNPQALKTHLRWCKEKPEIDGDQEIESKEPGGAGDE